MTDINNATNDATNDSANYPKTALNLPKQAPQRANYDRENVHKILDEALVMQVGFVANGRPQIIPMYGVRDGASIVFHGSRKSRFMRKLADGVELCISVTHVDGLLFGRSAFHHSMNYRSVVVHSRGHLATDDEKAKFAALVTNRFVAGRYDDVRVTAANEMKATDFLIVPIENVVAKIRTGDPVDDKADLDLPFWAGEVPLYTRFGTPRAAADLTAGINVPQNIRAKYGG
ncbi:MAG: pyridoxamine 5'-phosphate oxidase family protein [Rhizobiales bacterium]|nr:pyridoxamine 5'-phosphate oxidase family protein [Hyphomicrobiales bacterium]NRB14053.1 pyridoxamine 5'-phosphate oxidase family protein [Hyphomicrobiales bacterium]